MFTRTLAPANTPTHTLSRRITQSLFGIVALSASLLPFHAHAHGKTTDEKDDSSMNMGCDMKGMDMSKMSPEEHEKMMSSCMKKDATKASDKAKAHEHEHEHEHEHSTVKTAAPDCDMSHMDMTKITAEEHEKIMERCEHPDGEAKAAK